MLHVEWMKKFNYILFSIILSLSFDLWAAGPQVVEINVKGMTCPFCVYGIEKNLGKLPGVAKVQVSLEKKKARVVMKTGATADVEHIKKAILDAGFTPGDVTILPNEN
jgi:copper ion binding protein